MAEMTLNQMYSLISKFDNIFFRLRKWEAATVFFRVFQGEDPEDFRPGYDYERIQEEMAEVNSVIRYFEYLVAFIKANVHFKNNMSIDEMMMLRTDLQKKVKRLKGILDGVSKYDLPECGTRREECRNYDEKIVRRDWEKAKSELEDISEDLEYIYGNTIFSIEDDEEDWEEIAKDKNAYLDSVVDKDLLEAFTNALYNHFCGICADNPVYDPEELAQSESQMPWGLVPWWEYLEKR